LKIYGDSADATYMNLLPSPPPQKACAGCNYWTPNWIGDDGWGFCTWREAENRSRQPRMNRGSQFNLTAKEQVLETRADASCIQWTPAAARASVKRR